MSISVECTKHFMTFQEDSAVFCSENAYIVVLNMNKSRTNISFVKTLLIKQKRSEAAFLFNEAMVLYRFCVKAMSQRILKTNSCISYQVPKCLPLGCK